MYDLTYRPRRLRINPEMRDLVRETTLDVTDLIYPLFIVPGEGIKKEIDTLPGQYHLSVDEAVKVAQEAYDLGGRRNLRYYYIQGRTRFLCMGYVPTSTTSHQSHPRSRAKSLGYF